MRRFIRESAFQLARRDLAAFLADHEEDLIIIFHEELQRLDDEIPEENFFIDINMVGLGDTVLKAALRAFTRFLNDDMPATKDLETPDQILGRDEAATAEDKAGLYNPTQR